MYDAAGNLTGTSAVTGTVVTDTGGVVCADDGFNVHVYRSGVLAQTVGDTHNANDPVPQGGAWHFYQQGGAVPASDGSILVADATRGIDVLSPAGYDRSAAPDLALGQLGQRSRLLVVGKTRSRTAIECPVAGRRSRCRGRWTRCAEVVASNPGQAPRGTGRTVSSSGMMCAAQPAISSCSAATVGIGSWVSR